MFIACTTVAKRADADRMASEVILAFLAVCVQVEGPLRSFYRWQGQIEQAEEFRITVKCLPAQLADLERHVLSHHPYDTPEWLVLRAEHVGEKYLSWAEANSSNRPL